MLNIAIDKKDTHITEIEIEEAIDKSLQKTEIQRFSHFWEDGIREDNDKEEEISYIRRSILLSFANLNQKNKILSSEHIKDDLLNEFNEYEIEKVLKEFVDRRILIENNNIYVFRIKFFKHWLFKYGIEKIIMTLSDEQKIKQRKDEENNAKISSKEILDFVSQKQYKGQMLTTDTVRAYLNQFDNNINQRIIFQILQNCTYYNITNIKIIMKRLFSEIKFFINSNNLPAINYSSGKRVGNVLVSNLDSLGKSSTQYAKYFSDENMVLHNNTIEIGKILEKLKNDNKINFLIFVDDFIGTGNNIINNIREINKKYPEIFKKDIHIFMAIITGFLDAKEKIEQELEKLGFKNIKIIIHEPLNENNKCFSENSKIFTNSIQKKEAEDLCWNFGNKLVSNNPLGYGNCQVAIIFPETCPNNCLPILWAKNKDFIPLFERTIN